MLSMHKSVLDGILNHAHADAPLEACGILAGKDDTVVRFFPLKNIDRSAEHFSFDPAEQFSVARAIRSENLKTAAVYHSHPKTPARLSQEDIRLAHDPGVAYVIISLAGGAPVTKAFKVRDSLVAPEEIVIIDA